MKQGVLMFLLAVVVLAIVLAMPGGEPCTHDPYNGALTGDCS